MSLSDLMWLSSSSCFVSFLPQHLTAKDTVRSTFGECGDIKSVRFAEDRESGEFRGFGHVEFYDGVGVDEAMKLAGTDVMGRPIRVSF